MEKDACSGEIVVRDRDGNYSLGFEVPPIVDGNGEDDGEGEGEEGEVGRASEFLDLFARRLLYSGGFGRGNGGKQGMFANNYSGARA